MASYILWYSVSEGFALKESTKMFTVSSLLENEVTSYFLEDSLASNIGDNVAKTIFVTNRILFSPSELCLHGALPSPAKYDLGEEWKRKKG